jgi:hypothetical protein
MASTASRTQVLELARAGYDPERHGFRTVGVAAGIGERGPQQRQRLLEAGRAARHPGVGELGDVADERVTRHTPQIVSYRTL